MEISPAIWGGAILLHTILLIIMTVSAMNDDSFTIGSPLILIVLLDIPVSDFVITNDQNPFLKTFFSNWFDPGDASRLRLAFLFFLLGGLQWFLIGWLLGWIGMKLAEKFSRKSEELIKSNSPSNSSN